LDRFKVNRRIHALERRLAHTEAERSVRRKQRVRNAVPQIALVGYTNSGKSTLINRLCRADVLVEDKLFATLDTRARRGPVADGRSAVFIDTVGFIRALPHHLVPAFAATLETARDADVVLHVVDVASRSWEDDYEAVLEILESEVFSDSDSRPPILHVWNKADIAPEVRPDIADGVIVSAATGLGVDRLLRRLSELLFPDEQEVRLVVPFSAIGTFHGLPAARHAHVVEYTETGARIEARLTREERSFLERYGVTVSADADGPVEEP
jgi:GTP-binding protein HflX